MGLEGAMPPGSGLSEPHWGVEKKSRESGNYALGQVQPQAIGVNTFLKGAGKSGLLE